MSAIQQLGRLAVVLLVTICGSTLPVWAGQSLHRFALKITEHEILQTSENGVKADKEVLQIRVAQGERVQLRWSTWQPVCLHLHGYNIELRLHGDKPAVMEFDAHSTGRYPITAHSTSEADEETASHVTLLYIEVHP